MADSLNVSERLGFLGIDDDVSGRLREQAPVIAKALPEITDELYAHLRRWPALAPMLKDAATIERLKTSQISHWNALFSGVFDNAYFERTRAVGQAHNACGLEPRWYMGAYCFMLERMLPHLLPRRARVAVEPIAAVLRAVFLDMDVAVSSYIQESSTSKLRREMLALCDLLEAEIASSVGAISNQAERMRLGAERLLGVAKFVHETAASVEESATTAIGDIQSVAGATEQLDASSREIASQVAQTTELTRRAVDQSQSADESVRGLTDATGRIDAVVALVEKIAAQTKLLALNATIEAARAGEAGRGFSVVAAEVKALARQTEEAIQTIRGESEMIQSTARATIDLVGHVTEGIDAIAGVAAEVSHAAHQQQAATSEISQSAASAAEQAKLVGAQAQTVLAKADDTGQTAERVRQVASIVSGNIQDLQRRITTILRSSTGGDRRKEERYPVAVKCRVRVGARVLDAHTLDISAGGAHVAATGEHGYEPGGSGVIDFSGIGEIKATIVGVSSAGLHLKFTDIAPEQAQALRQKITDAKVADQPYIEQCQRLASEIKLGFEGALSQRRISRNELFDFDYEPIPNTDPQQYSSKFVLLCDDVIPGIVQPIVDADPKIAFCAPVDRNGYLPTHNRQYSAQQRPGETEWNKAHCRNRRIFDDRTGILAARNRKPALVQVYARDMGVEGVKMLKEIDAPIYVGAETWGNVRLALTL